MCYCTVWKKTPHRFGPIYLSLPEAASETRYESLPLPSVALNWVWLCLQVECFSWKRSTQINAQDRIPLGLPEDSWVPVLCCVLPATLALSRREVLTGSLQTAPDTHSTHSWSPWSPQAWTRQRSWRGMPTVFHCQNSKRSPFQK